MDFKDAVRHPIGLKSRFQNPQFIYQSLKRIRHMFFKIYIKSVQSALTLLLTTSGPRGTFSRVSTKRGCVSIIKLLQVTILRSLWASLGKALF